LKGERGGRGLIKLSNGTGEPATKVQLRRWVTCESLGRELLTRRRHIMGDKKGVKKRSKRLSASPLRGA